MQNYIKKIIAEQINKDISFENLELSDILSDKELMGLYDNDNMETYYQYYLNNGDNITEQIKESSHYKKAIKEYIKELFETFYYNIDDRIRNNSITIFRAITVDDDWLPSFSKNKIIKLGVYWAYDSKGAVTHWGDYNKKNEVILSGIVELDKIDWEGTFLVKLRIDQSDEEMEIRLKEGVEIDLTSITIEGEEVDPKLFENNKFIA